MWVIFLAAISVGTPSRVAAENSGHRLVLTAAMLHALDAWDPSFRPWEDRDYQPGILSTFKFSSYEAPFAVFGDYNGDGHIDVAIDGRTKTNTVEIVLLSSDSAYRLIILDKTALKNPKGEWYGVDTDRREYGLWVFLGRRWPAHAPLGIEEPVVRPPFESFERQYWRKGASVFYWDGRKFREVVTGD
jgi:hypothetical protein